MSKYEYRRDVVAEPYIVKGFANHLIASYEGYIRSFPVKIDYIDGLMAVVNFCKAVLNHLEEDSGQGNKFWHSTFVTTFQHHVFRAAGGEKHLYDTYFEQDGLSETFSQADSRELCIAKFEQDFGYSWEEAAAAGWKCVKVCIPIAG